MAEIIGYAVFVVSTLLTYALGIISKKHKWNDTMPIPVQNCIVGAVVFVVAYAFCLITKTDCTAQDILHQILLSFGGVGTATLGYDLQKVDKE